MIFDYENLFEEDQTDTTVATHYSVNYINKELTGDALEQVRFLCQVTETFTSGGAGTAQFLLQSASESTFSSNLVTHLDSGAIALATLVAGYKPFGAGCRVPVGMGVFQRTALVIGTSTMTAGKVTTGYTNSVQSNT